MVRDLSQLAVCSCATARRDFAAFAPEALRLARADAGAVLEGTSVHFRHHDADRWATLAFADDHMPTSLTYADHDPVLGDIAYLFTPGIYTGDEVVGWRKVTEATTFPSTATSTATEKPTLQFGAPQMALGMSFRAALRGSP